jgi:hypothetical protein
MYEALLCFMPLGPAVNLWILMVFPSGEVVGGMMIVALLPIDLLLVFCFLYFFLRTAITATSQN